MPLSDFRVKLLLVALSVLLLVGSASATCSGSALVWSCTAGSTGAQVQTAINAASDQAVITFANGTYSNISQVLVDGSSGNRNGVTLICATVRGCTISTINEVFVATNEQTIDITNLVRISGFVFSGAAASDFKIWFYLQHNFDKVRIDNNTFQNSGNRAILMGESTRTAHAYGSIDHNIFTGTNNYLGFESTGDFTPWPTDTNNTQGGFRNMFVEDNTFNFTNMSNNGLGCVDATGGHGVVFRFNTATNCRVVNHSSCHSGGPYNIEVYGNTINDNSDTPNGYRLIHNQGSATFMVFNNVLSPAQDSNIALLHYRSDASQMPQGSCTAAEVCDGTFTATSGIPLADENRSPIGTYHGYACWHQPGRDGNGVLKPIYFWHNTVSGTGAKISVSIESGGNMDSHVKANRDYFETVGASGNPVQTSPTAPFNGTTGVGYGTLANRPTTCTKNSETLDAGHGGVGYWATDQGSWNSSGNGFGSGVLYSCTATNTWTLAYTPYTYPHPLVGAAPSAPVVQLSCPAAPCTGLTFGPQALGTQSASQTVTLTNTGTAVLSITSLLVVANQSSGRYVDLSSGGGTPCGSTLAISASCQIIVAFQPVTAGTTTGSMSIADNASGSPQSIPLIGTGVVNSTFQGTSLIQGNNIIQ